MFIELTDHLRCPADHQESFLVLLPDRVEDRSVRAGQLGCPICGRSFELADGVLDTGDAPPDRDGNTTRLDGEAMSALAGLSGPGGYMVLVGPPGRLWKEFAELNPGVALVVINPGDQTADAPGVSVLRSGRIPLKSHSMRGVVLGQPYGDDPGWIEEAARVVLPGLRVVGEGSDPPASLIDLMASAGGAWVGVKKR